MERTPISQLLRHRHRQPSPPDSSADSHTTISATMPQEQTVFRLSARNSFNDITEHKEQIPSIDKHEILVKIKSVALNYRDIMIATSKYPFPVKDKVVPCSDGAGEVVEVGDAVSGLFSKGDKVVGNFDIATQYGTIQSWNYGLGGPVDGVLRQYIALPAYAVAKIPEDSTLSFAQWASVVCTGTTAWNAMFGNVTLKPGQWVLFQGTGGVSVTGLILAKAAGAKTIITSSSDEKLQHVKETYGADYTINYKKTPDWAAEAKKITKGQGVDFVLENGGSGTIKQSIDAIKMGGHIGVIGFLSPAKQENMPDVASMAINKGCIVRGVVIGSFQLFEEVVRFVGEKNLNLPVEKTFGFSRDEVVKAYEYLASGQHIGKVCINVD